MLLLLNRGYFLHLNLRPWQCKLTPTKLVFAHGKSSRKGTRWQGSVCVCVCICLCMKPCVYYNIRLLSLCVWAHACLCRCVYSMFQSMNMHIWIHLRAFGDASICLWPCVCEWNMLNVHVFKIATMWCRLQYLKCSTIFTHLSCASVARAEVSPLTRFLLISSLCIYRAALAGPQAKPILFDSP